jgi:hypothetical protein
MGEDELHSNKYSAAAGEEGAGRGRGFGAGAMSEEERLAAGRGGAGGAGGRGSGGMGHPGGGGRREDDREHKSSYLIEGDDVFGTDVKVAPPVIGAPNPHDRP